MASEIAFSQLERAINPTHDIKLFSGRSNPKLAQEIADCLGTTIGPITSSLLTIPVMDMGAPLLSMHSIRELASVKDNEYTIKLFTEFYNL